MSRSGPRLIVHIERLVLEGLPLRSADGPLIQAALEAELTRLLTVRGLAPELAAGGATASLSPAAIGNPVRREPSALGSQVAHALGGVLGGGR